MTNLQQREVNPNRQKLISLSAGLRLLVKDEVISSVNEGLIETYKNDTHKYFYTLRQWNARGFIVNKGAEAFLVWGRKKDKHKKVDEQLTSEVDYTFWPICFLFSNAQVTAKEKKGAQEA